MANTNANTNAMTITQSLARQLARMITTHNLGYQQFIRICSDARRLAGLTQPRTPRRLPHLLSAEELTRFYTTVDKAESLMDGVMLRLLLYAGVRVSELVVFRLGDVDLDGRRLYVDQGKGSKDRYVLIPDHFALILRMYITSLKSNTQTDDRNPWLFPSPRTAGHVTARYVQLRVQEYAKTAGLSHLPTPHRFRHQLLTHLTKAGVPDAAIQLISGHSSKKSLEVYQHVGLGDVVEGYQDAMRKVQV